jgi:transcriptional regulator with XRE-family HTH domain
MTPDCQALIGPIAQKSCISCPFYEMHGLSYSADRMASAERVGDRIREWRLARRLTQEGLGEKIGSDGSRVGRLEKGAENPTLETLDKLADALVIDVAQLFASRPGVVDHASESAGGGAGLADSLGRALHEYEQTGDVPKDWRGDVLVAIFALTRALQRPAVATGPARQAKEA